MVNFGALNFIKKLKKALYCINHVIYTPVLVDDQEQSYLAASYGSCSEDPSFCQF